MNIYTLELNNDIKGVAQRKQYIESLIAKTSNPDLIVLPELALCSYIGSTEIWQYADHESIDTSKWAMETAAKYDTAIAVGYLAESQGDYYNSYLIADKDDVYGVIKKSEGESYIFKRGYFSNVIETPFGNVAVAICYDARRKHFYENISDKTISLIVFPHGSPSNPDNMEAEQKTIDYFCKAYQSAYNVPVIYTNSKGVLPSMMGRTGKMMQNAGFRLNGMSAVYDSESIIRSTDNSEILCWSGTLAPQKRNKNIRFYGQDIVKGNFLFRKLILQPDTKKGIAYYEKRQKCTQSYLRQ